MLNIKLNRWKTSSINLDSYLSQDDLNLLRNPISRKNKKGKNTIITRSLVLVKKAKKGDIEARNTLFLLHTPLIRSILNKKFYIHPTEFDEHISECFFYFMNAVKDFNPKTSNNFIHMLQLKIYQGYINDYHKDKRKHIRGINYEEIDKEYETENNFLSIDEGIYKLENDE